MTTATNKKPAEFYATYRTVVEDQPDEGQPKRVLHLIDRVFTAENAQLRAAIADKTDIVTVRAGETVNEALYRVSGEAPADGEERGELHVGEAVVPTSTRSRKGSTAGD